jgi:acetyl esterase
MRWRHHHIGAHAADFGIDDARLGICGDSASGTLAAATAYVATGRRIALRLQLHSRLLPHHPSGAICQRYLIDQATLDHDLLHYVPPGTDRDPRISPLRADNIAGLPRL